MRLRSPVQEHLVDKKGMERILWQAKGQYRVLYVTGGMRPLRAGEALGLEIGKHISPDCRTLCVRQESEAR
jgi:hypothetical protein